MTPLSFAAYPVSKKKKIALDVRRINQANHSPPRTITEGSIYDNMVFKVYRVTNFKPIPKLKSAISIQTTHTTTVLEHNFQISLSSTSIETANFFNLYNSKRTRMATPSKSSTCLSLVFGLIFVGRPGRFRQLHQRLLTGFYQYRTTDYKFPYLGH